MHTLNVISRYNVQCYVIKTHTLLELTWYRIYNDYKYNIRLFILVVYIIRNHENVIISYYNKIPIFIHYFSP